MKLINSEVGVVVCPFSIQKLINSFSRVFCPGKNLSRKFPGLIQSPSANNLRTEGLFPGHCGRPLGWAPKLGAQPKYLGCPTQFLVGWDLKFRALVAR